MVKITTPIIREWIAAVERAARMLKLGYQATRVGEGVYQGFHAQTADFFVALASGCAYH